MSILERIKNLEEITKNIFQNSLEQHKLKIDLDDEKNIQKIDELEEQICLLCEAHENDIVFMSDMLNRIEAIQNDIRHLRDEINHKKIK